MDMVRADAETVPSRSMPGMGDFPSAMGVYAAIATALYRREKTGQGGVVRSSLLQNGLWANGCAIQTRLFHEDVQLRPHRDHAPNPLANHYRSRDDRWFIMALFNEQRQLRSFLGAIGREDLADDPRFATSAARARHARELVMILDAEFAKKDLADWRRILDSVGVTFGIVATVNEALDDPQMRDCGALVPFADGQGLTVMTPFHIDGVEKVAAERAPAVGQHNEMVLRDAGYTSDEVEQLRGLGVLG
jgi:formyl-CoA transferase